LSHCHAPAWQCYNIPALINNISLIAIINNISLIAIINNISLIAMLQRGNIIIEAQASSFAYVRFYIDIFINSFFICVVP